MIRGILHWLLPDPRAAELRRALHNARLTLTLLEGDRARAERERDQLKRRLLDLADDLEANRLSDGRTVAHLVVLKLRGLTR